MVDGQQRLATTAIFIAAVRDYFDSHALETKARSLEDKYLFSRNLRTDEIEPKLRLNRHDNDFFMRTVLASSRSRVKIDAQYDSHRRIQVASDLAHKRVEAIASVVGAACADALVKWVLYLEQQVQVIKFEVADYSDAFMVFETLNDRGMKLATSDLLKNYIFYRAGRRLEEADSQWSTMTGLLESVGEDNIVVDFVRHLWSSRHGLTREQLLYKDIRSQVKTADKAVALAKDLGDQAKTYLALTNANHRFWETFGEEARKHIATLNTVLRMEQMRPLLLAVVCRFPNREVVKALRLLVASAVRSIVVGTRGGSLEKFYAEQAVAVNNQTIRNEKQLRAQFVAIVPGDEQFVESFSVASVAKGYLARYYLHEIEAYVNTERAGWIPDPVVDDVNLEHVLPKTYTSEWKPFTEESHRSFVRRLGNLALIGSTENSTIGNGAFARKRSGFADSSFMTTALLAKATAWTPETIGARQRRLAEVAAKVWPVSGDKIRATPRVLSRFSQSF